MKAWLKEWWVVVALLVLAAFLFGVRGLLPPTAQASSMADPRLMDSLPRYEIVCGDANPCVKYDEITGNAWVLVNRPGGWTWIGIAEVTD